ncbi:hypothetical protein E1B28_004215 [Marasmius oreades]|nr:uncharacterized protein E1B28_004215 [Marasmius oreades]KAG7096807.1 hypothetical protein E1B28_004215 [Marasmius oreades]
MIDCGLEAVLIKVAGIGLNPKHLGKTLREMQPTLLRLNTLYGSHVCGEGGEYESLTLDCPSFKSSIILKEVETVIHSDNDFATVAFLRIKDAYLLPKLGPVSSRLYIPPLLADEALRVKDMVTEAQTVNSGCSRQRFSERGASMDTLARVGVQKFGQWVAVSNVQVDPLEGVSLEDEVLNCFELLKEHLSSHGSSLSQAVNINLFLSSMDYFPRVNSVYSTFFGTSPPARACVAVDLSGNVRIRLDCTAMQESSGAPVPMIQRHSLHVQSQSYWAPANIGPYSQAIVAGERIFISGQIGLLPSTVTLPEPRSLSIEMALATQHVDRIVNVLRNSWDGHNQSSIYWIDDVANLNAVRNASGICSKDKTAVKLYVVVQALPKRALVEKQVMFHTGRAWISEPDADARDGEEYSLKSFGMSHTQNVTKIGGTELHCEKATLDGSSEGFTLFCIKWGTNESRDVAAASLRSYANCFDSALSVRCFYSMKSKPPYSMFATLERTFSGISSLPITVIPCRFLATQNEDDWDCVLAIINV